MTPAAEQIAARKLAILLDDGRSDRGIRRDRNALSDCALIEVALQRHRIATLQVPVHPETALSHLPVIEVLVIWMELGTSSESFAINAIVKFRAVSASMPEIEEALLVSTAGGDDLTVGVFRALGDNIDHAINGVRAPDRCTRTADDFDPVHILHQRVLNFPIDAGI